MELKEINRLMDTTFQSFLPPYKVTSTSYESRAVKEESLYSERVKAMTKLMALTKRNVICYFSSWVQYRILEGDFAITDNDMNGFLDTVSSIKERNKGLDLLLHTPGGDVAATESIVRYLQECFNGDIRVIVPHMAMSAGTMIACASTEILMGRASSLGAIDPQFDGIPVQGVLKEFTRALEDVKRDPNTSLIWKEVVGKYPIAFLTRCENASALGTILAREWLMKGMFNADSTRQDTVDNILRELAQHDSSKLHSRHYGYNKCKQLGLTVTALEDNMELYEAVYTLYYLYFLSVYKLGDTSKFIESPFGSSFTIKTNCKLVS